MLIENLNEENEENIVDNDTTEDNEKEEEKKDEVEAVESTESTEELPFNIDDVVTGTVYKIEDKFIKAHIDGTDFEGIVPISQLTNQRIEKPEEVVNIDDQISGVVIKVENEENRQNVILSIRKLEETKVYESLEEKKNNDETITGKVTEVVKAGLVLDVGVRGFIPASLISDSFVEDLEQFADQELEVKIEEIEFDKNRVILNRKRIVESEKNENKKAQLESLNVGDIVEGTVVRTTNFGAFVDLGNIDGLVHISQLSYSRVEKVEDAVEIGQKVEVKILDIKPEEERVSLSIKQAGQSPFTSFVEQHAQDDVLDGVVKRLVDFGAFVEVAPGVEGLVHVSEISYDHVNVPSDVLEVNQEIQVKILSINEEEEKISLSIKATQEQADRPKQQARPKKESTPKVYSDDSNSDEPTLGDLFGDKFKDFKG
ncbi:30S ribosomal protein S1 [Aliicoccus persicus]|uniref:SSU ribosomal protein S1P n=1 Tax=Aliicoccus persicus TaxID=930138 RepID=A0A662Z0W1_9STAP|nr:30S ribosomal protein S1 [Aliicoccus persicus]SEV83709.1 SSU ribosomal protein S1P [Aliicoccus persicus]